MSKPRASARIARFVGVKPDPGNCRSLKADHPAAVEGRTIFPGNVASTASSQRFLVSGVNNSKIGKAVEKGAWAGMPIFTLTLEERKTCPRSCESWLSCYGNAQQWPKRWDHTDPDFLPALAAEVITLGRANPKGFVVRLHVLGDFYSAEYVLFWAELLAKVPSLHVYGYTARHLFDGDRESAKIAECIGVLTDHMWNRFAIRTSSSEDVAFSRAIVVEEDPNLPDVIVCPAQTGATECCGSCGLCWSPNARDKTIAFLRHGMKRLPGPRAAVKPVPVAPPAPSLKPAPAQPAERLTVPQQVVRRIEAAAPDLFERYPLGVHVATIMEAVGATYNQTAVALAQLHKAGKFSYLKPSTLDQRKVLLPAGAVEEVALTENQAKVLAVLLAHAVEGRVRVDRLAFRAETGLQIASFDLCVQALRQKGWTKHVGVEDQAAVYQLLRTDGASPPAPTPAVIISAPSNEAAKRDTPAPRPVLKAPPAAPATRAIPKGARIVNLGDGVQRIDMKPVTERVARMARAQIENGADPAFVADCFDLDVDAMEDAIKAIGKVRA